jgi:hypothetical protein
MHSVRQFTVSYREFKGFNDKLISGVTSRSAVYVVNAIAVLINTFMSYYI